MDAAAASVGEDPHPASELSVRWVAEHVLAVAWPHVVPFAIEPGTIRLRQMNDQRRATSSSRPPPRHAAGPTPSGLAPLQLRQADSSAYEGAVTRIVRQLLRYPLALLQRTDAYAPDFLYRSLTEGRERG